MGGYLNDTVDQLRRELIFGSLFTLELSVPDGRNVVPCIGQVHAVWVHRAPVAAVVLHFLSAMTADLDRRPDLPEFGLPGRLRPTLLCVPVDRFALFGFELEPEPRNRVESRRSRFI